MCESSLSKSTPQKDISITTQETIDYFEREKHGHSTLITTTPKKKVVTRVSKFPELITLAGCTAK